MNVITGPFGIFGSAWLTLGATELMRINRLWESLLSRYAEPHRHYHNIRHIEECLQHIADLGISPEDKPNLFLAVFYHDAIYLTDSSDISNKVGSANLFREASRQLGVDPGSVPSMILATESHKATYDEDTDLLISVDMAILASNAERYAEYANQIRQEYAHVPDNLYREGRGLVLSDFLASARHNKLFPHPSFRHLHALAVVNLEEELRKLNSQ